tara:strand:+ start:119 stop:394 length:276 start_codon:yes stop_codon:yes gene_type:complete
LSRRTRVYKNKLKREKRLAMEELKNRLNGLTKRISKISKAKQEKVRKSVHREIKRIGNLAKFDEKKIKQSRHRRHKPTIKINVGFEYKKDK